MNNNESHKTVIECDCGSHMLQVQSEVDYHGENNEQFHQDFYLAMYHYGSKNTGWKHRLKVMWKVLTTGEAYADQLVLNPDEAKKLAVFIHRHIKN